MRRHIFWIGVCAATALLSAARAEPAKDAPPLRLELDLIDGSRLIGTPGIATVPVQTSYAKMDVPLTQIQALKIGDDHETVTLNLRNGDTLTGVISLKPIELKTVFGTVAIGIDRLRAIRVVLTGGALPESLRKGLVLHYSFDRDEDGKVTDGSAKENHGTVRGARFTPEGKSGGAMVFDGADDYLDAGNPPSLQLTSDFTLAAWICQEQTQTHFGIITNPHFPALRTGHRLFQRPSPGKQFPSKKWDFEQAVMVPLGACQASVTGYSPPLDEPSNQRHFPRQPTHGEARSGG